MATRARHDSDAFGRGTCGFIQGWSEIHSSGMWRVECAVQGFKLRSTSLSIDRLPQDHAFIDGLVTGLVIRYINREDSGVEW